MPLVLLLLACGARDPAPATPAEEPGESPTTLLPLAAYTAEPFHGATVLWHPDFAHDPALAERVRAALAHDLDAYTKSGPAASVSRLGEVRIAVAVTTPELAELPSKGRGMGHHRSARWLTEHGFDAEREAVVEIYDAADYLAQREERSWMLSGAIDGVLELRAGPEYRILPLRDYTPERLAPATVLWHPTLQRELVTRVRAALDEDLATLRRVAPPEAVARLEGVRLVVNERSFDGEGMRKTGLAHHRSATWLVENGYDAAREGTVEVFDAEHYLELRVTTQPMVLVHELTHVLTAKADAATYAALRAAYEAAVGSGRYDAVAHVTDPAPRRAYALNNDAEYAAELAEALFGRNDFAPFDRAELVAFDPVGCAAVARVWATVCPAE